MVRPMTLMIVSLMLFGTLARGADSTTCAFGICLGQPLSAKTVGAREALLQEVVAPDPSSAFQVYSVVTVPSSSMIAEIVASTHLLFDKEVCAEALKPILKVLEEKYGPFKSTGDGLSYIQSNTTSANPNTAISLRCAFNGGTYPLVISYKNPALWTSAAAEIGADRDAALRRGL